MVLIFRPCGEEVVRSMVDIQANIFIGLEQMGYPYDEVHEPDLHPYIDQLPSPPTKAQLATRYWNNGANWCADAFVASEERIALIQRKSGLWAFMGGFREQNENGVDNAVRECKEETGLILDPKNGTVIYEDVMASPDVRADAYTMSTVVGFLLDKEAELKPDLTEVLDARWVPFDEVLAGSIKVVPGHLLIIKDQLKQQSTKSPS